MREQSDTLLGKHCDDDPRPRCAGNKIFWWACIWFLAWMVSLKLLLKLSRNITFVSKLCETLWRFIPNANYEPFWICPETLLSVFWEFPKLCRSTPDTFLKSIQNCSNHFRNCPKQFWNIPETGLKPCRPVRSVLMLLQHLTEQTITTLFLNTYWLLALVSTMPPKQSFDDAWLEGVAGGVRSSSNQTTD